MVFINPEEGTGDEEIAHFIAAVIENQCAPFRMGAFSRVFMFVKGGTVEAGKAVRITWKMSRNPVKDVTDFILVALVNEIHEVFRYAVSAGQAERSGNLVSPRFVQWMFHYRQQFDMGEFKVFYIGNQLVGEFPESEETVRGCRVATP